MNHYGTQTSYSGGQGQTRSVGAITGSIGELEKSMASLLAQVERMESHLESSGLLRGAPGLPANSEKRGDVPPTSDSALSCNIRAQAHRAAAMEQRLSGLLDRLDV